MSPKLVDKPRRKQEIIQAALECFAERGFEAVSMSDIAKYVGVSKGTLYLYVDSKQELILAAARFWVELVKQRLPETMDQHLDPETRLRGLLEQSTKGFLEDPRIVRLFLGIVQTALSPHSAFDNQDVIGQVSGPIRDAISQILSEGIHHGYLSKCYENQVDALARNIVAFVDGLGLHYLAASGHLDFQSQLELYLQGLFHQLRHGVHPTPKDT